MNNKVSNIELDEGVLYGSFIKYNVLKDLTLQALSHSTSDKLNVFIDMYSLLEPLYRYKSVIHIYTNISAIIINLCAHIRAYYRSYHKVETVIYLINSKNTPMSAKQFYIDYNFKIENSMIQNKPIVSAIVDNSNILNVLCPYLPDVFYIEDNNTESSVIIQNIIEKIRPNNPMVPNLVISKDPYCYQLVAINPDVVIFRPRKSGNGIDQSWCVTRNNLYEVYRHKDLLNKNIEANNILAPELFSLVLSFAGLPCRNIYNVFNISNSIKILENAIINGRILNAYSNDVEYTLSLIDYNRVKAPEYFIKTRFQTLDLNFQHYIYKNCPSEASILNNVVNLYDPDAVREINDKYFINNPLDLNRL